MSSSERAAAGLRVVENKGKDGFHLPDVTDISVSSAQEVGRAYKCMPKPLSRASFRVRLGGVFVVHITVGLLLFPL
jgi:hypothetical protein